MALVIQLVDRMCNDCFKLKHLFLLSLDLVDILVKNVDELGSEHHVRTHINEPPCYDKNPNFCVFVVIQLDKMRRIKLR